VGFANPERLCRKKERGGGGKHSCKATNPSAMARGLRKGGRQPEENHQETADHRLGMQKWSLASVGEKKRADSVAEKGETESAMPGSYNTAKIFLRNAKYRENDIPVSNFTRRQLGGNNKLYELSVIPTSNNLNDAETRMGVRKDQSEEGGYIITRVNDHRKRTSRG